MLEFFIKMKMIKVEEGRGFRELMRNCAWYIACKSQKGRGEQDGKKWRDEEEMEKEKE